MNEGVGQEVGMNIETGELVTAADAPDGMPTWVGVVLYSHKEGDSKVKPLGRVPHGTRTRDASTFWRPLSDAEALAIATWLLTGDPGAEWESTGDDVFSGMTRRVYSLQSWDDGEWWVYADQDTDEEVPRYRGTAPTDQARRVAASRAFLAHLCRAACESGICGQRGFW